MQARKLLTGLAITAILVVSIGYLLLEQDAPLVLIEPSIEAPVAAPRDDPMLTAVAEPTRNDEPVRVEALSLDKRVPPAERQSQNEPAPTPEPASSSTPSGLIVTGSVRFADDRSPAAGASFVLNHAEGYVVVHADDAGRFRTEPVVAAGVADLYHRTTEAGGEYPLPLRFEPASISLAGRPGSEAVVEFLLKRPETELQVRVVHRDGRAAPGANVELETRTEVRPGQSAHRRTADRTDAEGHVRFALFDVELLRAVGLGASLEEESPSGDTRRWVSSELSVALPMPLGTAPIVLVLDEPGSLLVSVRDEGGSQVAGIRIWLYSESEFMDNLARDQRHTDELGEALFDGLSAGTYRVRSSADARQENLSVDVWHNTRSTLDLVVPTTEVRLAAAGRVVDESGAPLHGVLIRARYDVRQGARSTRGSASTDTDGFFELRAAPHASVTVHSDHDIFGDEYEPEFLEVPFGTIDMLFTRVREIPREQIDFEIVDAINGARLPGALVMIYRATNLGDYSFHNAVDGLASPLCARHSDTALAVVLSGYRRAIVILDELMLQEPVDGLRRVALDAGLLRWLRVADNDEVGQSSSIPGARVRLGERELGITDGRGELLLDFNQWPKGEITVEADGYESGTWTAAEGVASLAPSVVRLVRE